MDRSLLWHFPYYHPEQGYADAKESIGMDDFCVSKTRPQSAIRRGRYKLIWFAENERFELYDLQVDIGEQSDLSDAQADIADNLYEELRRSLDQRHDRRRTGCSCR